MLKVMATIDVVGDTFADINIAVPPSLNLSLPLGKDTILAAPVSLTSGGSALNTATHLAALGNIVRLHTALNEADDFGRMIVKHCEQHKIKLMNHYTDDGHDGATGHCVVYSSSDDRGFLSHHGVLSKFSPASILFHACHSDHLHVGGFFNLDKFCANGGDLTLSLIDRFKNRYERASVSLGPQYDASENWEIKKPLLESLDFLILDEVEADKIAFSRKIPRCTCVTRGSKGASVGDCAIPAPIVDRVVDVTGAGDAFAAGFISKSLENNDGDQKDAIAYGCAVGAACIKVRSASAALDPVDITTMYEQLQTIIRKNRPEQGTKTSWVIFDWDKTISVIEMGNYDLGGKMDFVIERVFGGAERFTQLVHMFQFLTSRSNLKLGILSFNSSDLIRNCCRMVQIDVFFETILGWEENERRDTILPGNVNKSESIFKIVGDDFSSVLFVDDNQRNIDDVRNNTQFATIHVRNTHGMDSEIINDIKDWATT